jgi:hypothetical protein
MTLLEHSARVLFAGLVLCPLLAGQQLCTSEHQYPCADDSFMRPYPVVIQFDREAKASDPAGIREYSDDLTWFLVRDQVDKNYRNALTDRLAKAEEVAREGKGRLIPEADVVRVFNDMMRRIGAPNSVRADENAMHAFRQHSIDVPALPALFSASHNGTYCYPGEAVFLLYTLIVYNGAPPRNLLDEVMRLRDLYAATPHPVLKLLPNVERDSNGLNGGFANAIATSSVGIPAPPVKDAEGLLSRYSIRHRRGTTKLFNRAAQAFRF